MCNGQRTPTGLIIGGIVVLLLIVSLVIDIVTGVGLIGLLT